MEVKANSCSKAGGSYEGEEGGDDIKSVRVSKSHRVKVSFLQSLSLQASGREQESSFPLPFGERKRVRGLRKG